MPCRADVAVLIARLGSTIHPDDYALPSKWLRVLCRKLEPYLGAAAATRGGDWLTEVSRAHGSPHIVRVHDPSMNI